MDKLSNLGDTRLLNGCVYCGGHAKTREHVPSRAFLDTPYPNDLPTMGACEACNNGFSSDEQFVACLIEAARAGTSDPETMRRPSIASALSRSPSLRAHIDFVLDGSNGDSLFGIGHASVRRILLKLARGHAHFELSKECRGEPASAWWRPLSHLGAEELDDFDAAHVLDSLGEIGSRGSQGTLIVQMNLVSPDGSHGVMSLAVNDWVEVQEGRYRYLAIDEGENVRVKIVIGEYLACEIEW